MPVSTMRLTYSDGDKLDIFSDLEFVGLSEEEFRGRLRMRSLETQAELRGLNGPHSRAI
jgi:hypothetical protein